jgi:sugar transferase (PEP-CTERM system associated)
MIQIFSQYFPIRTLLLAVLETLLVAIAVVCGAKLRFWNDPAEFQAYIQLPDFGLQLIPVIGVFQVTFHYAKLYDFSGIRPRLEDTLRLWQSIGTASLILGALYFVFPSLLIGRGVFAISLGLIPLFMLANRFILDRAWRFASPPERILILGAKEFGIVVSRELRRRKDLNVNVVGFINGDQSAHAAEIAEMPVFGDVTSVEQVARDQRVSRIIVALEDRRGNLPIRDLVRLRLAGVRVEDVHSTMAALTGRVCLETLRPSWFVFSEGFRRSRSTLVIKRIIDVLISCTFLIITSPFLMIIAVLIRLESRGPVIYHQERVGLCGKLFNVLKFRSMTVDAEAKNGAQWASADDPRITRVGRFIRRYRIDELPQVINVLRGDMSFVGPRPERPVFVDSLRQQISYYDERHSVRPGITGWAQVSYPYGATVEDTIRKLEYDLFYLKNLSIFFDCAIILRTIRIVLMGQGSR